MGRNYFRDTVDFTRAALRKRRLDHIEDELKREEALALKKVKELQALQESFASVKVEFSDLDGQIWTKSNLRMRSQQTRFNALRARSFADGSLPPPSNFVVLSNADLDSFSPEDTIRASGRRRPRVFERPPSSSTSTTMSGGTMLDSGPSRQSVFTLFSDPWTRDAGNGENNVCEAEFEPSKPETVDTPEDEDFRWLSEDFNLAEIPDEDDDEAFWLDDFPMPPMQDTT
ncbi:hypothetical protein BDN72DRAFT_961519 [Pluteus cervinus]|uniref:Uncharacterized protein n=1 Tax=Pluteus cervinus TaxID=181527 RepID=A0ACD3AN21_9AGAR|nr:hypothetical protein BDN72DRAFT_961519 [Pluteus cervinus]